MLTLVFSLGAAVFLLGPELVSRWVFGFAVERRNLVQTRAEEVTRALIWASVPWSVTLLWLWLDHRVHLPAGSGDWRVLFSGLYSETFYQEHIQEFFTSFHAVRWTAFEVAWRLYLTDFVLAASLAVSLSNFAYLNSKPVFRPLVWLLNKVVLSRVATWHLLLSGMLLPSAKHQLHADVLLKNGVMYQGRVREKTLTGDGALQSLVLADPRRFLREPFEEHKKEWPGTDSAKYWKPIPGNMFIVLGSEISNLNLRYLAPIVLSKAVLSEKEQEVAKALLEKL
jgi:hypothetical protein